MCNRVTNPYDIFIFPNWVLVRVPVNNYYYKKKDITFNYSSSKNTFAKE